MTTPRQQRMSRSFGWDPSRRAVGSPVERLLVSIGADASFTDDLLGDLAEERAQRAALHGALRAGAWYLYEAARAVPHLAWNAARHGGSAGRVRVAALCAAVVLLPALVLTVAMMRAGAPVRLVVEGQRGRLVSQGLIVNSRHPVQLKSTAFDARGRALGPEHVQFRWTGGDSLHVAPNGILTCTREADATVTVTAGRMKTTVPVQCRPVHHIFALTWMQFVVGDAGLPLKFEAEGPDGYRVDLLAGERVVEDTSIARLEGNMLRPLKPGRTHVVIRMGDAVSQTGVSVLEPVPALAGLRPDQRYVIAPVKLAAGDTIRWPLPDSIFTLIYRRDRDTALPVMRLSGPVTCLPAFGPGVERSTCLSRGPGAAVQLTSPGSSRVSGRLALEAGARPRRL